MCVKILEHCHVIGDNPLFVHSQPIRRGIADDPHPRSVAASALATSSAPPMSSHWQELSVTRARDFGDALFAYPQQARTSAIFRFSRTPKCTPIEQLLSSAHNPRRTRAGHSCNIPDLGCPDIFRNSFSADSGSISAVISNNSRTTFLRVFIRGAFRFSFHVRKIFRELSATPAMCVVTRKSGRCTKPH